MTDEIRKKAIEKSREFYPEETEIFERWEKCIEIYNSGFWNTPYNFNEIIQFWNTDDPFTRDQRQKTLYSCTTLLNDLLTYGRCHKWIMYVMEMVFSPEIYAVMRLLLAAAYSARTAHPFQRNGAPFRFKLSKAQQVD